MSDYGVNEQGFNIKPLAEIQTDIKNRLALITDPETGERLDNITDDSLLGVMIGIFSDNIYQMWQLAQVVYGCLDPRTANGAALRSLSLLNGITLNASTNTELKFKATGKPGITIISGSIVSDESGDHPFTIIGNHIIGPDGEVEFNAICQVQGAYNPKVGEINTIQTGTYGWNTVSNIGVVSIGSEQETDKELRLRQQKSTSNTSYGQIDAIRAAVANVNGVEFCRAYQNSGLETDENGIPPKSIAVVVVGGYDEEIANVIFNKSPVGIGFYGSTNVNIFDEQNVSTSVRFSRPIEVPIYVELSIKITDTSTFPVDYEQQIRENIINYVTTGDENRDGIIQPGQDIIRTRLFTPINYLSGFSIKSLKIGTTPESVSESDVNIAWNEKSSWLPDNITVTVEE